MLTVWFHIQIPQVVAMLVMVVLVGMAVLGVLEEATVAVVESRVPKDPRVLRDVIQATLEMWAHS